MSFEFVMGIENWTRQNDNAVTTVGTFDGIHLGHQEILRRATAEAERLNADPVLVTFHPHPRVLVTPDNVPSLLTTIEEKEQFLPCFFDGRVVVLEFNQELKNLDPEEFVTSILLDKLGTRKLIVGYDHAFGRNRKGDVRELKRLADKFGFDFEVVGPIDAGGEAVSSSRIRKLVAGDGLRDAIGLLGHQYAVQGSVERGIGLGRRIGYPTANVAYGSRKLLPREGVYACWVQVDNEEFDGMMFIGRNHFNPAGLVTVEANLFDFDRDIYDQLITVYPTHFLRESVKFESTDELVDQLEKDKENVLRILKEESNHVPGQRRKSTGYCGKPSA